MKAVWQSSACQSLCAALCAALCLISSASAQPSAHSSTQILVATTPDWNAVDGVLRRYERGGPRKRWKSVGKPVAVVVGKTGLAWGRGLSLGDDLPVRPSEGPVKIEGDGKSPAGVFPIGTAFGYAAQPLPGWKMPYLPLTASVECVDDPASKFYNRLVDRAAVAPDWKSSEHMRDTGQYYRWGMVVEHNEDPAAPGGGSCIFLHIWGGPGQGTVGCTAMDRSELERVLAWLDPQKSPLLMQLPAAEYEKLRRKWQLPGAPRKFAPHTGGL